MNEFRKLMETLSRIEEGKFSELDIELQELKARKPDATPEEIVAHIRRVMGDDAAEYVAKNVANLGEDKDIFHNKLKGEPLYVGFGQGGDIERAVNVKLKGADHEIHGYDHADRPNLIKVTVSDYDDNMQELMYDKDLKVIVDPLDKDFDAWMDQNPFESLEESFGEETYDEMVEYWKQSLSSSIVRKGVFTQMYDAAGQDIDVLNAAIEDEAHSIAERYHGSGEGIGTSDQNHFIASIASQLGIDDVFGWRKPKESIEEDGRNSIPREKIKRFANLVYNIEGGILDRLLLKGRGLSRESAERKLIKDGFSVAEVSELQSWLKKAIENVAGEENILMQQSDRNFGGWSHATWADDEAGMKGIGLNLESEKEFNRKVMDEFNKLAWVQPGVRSEGLSEDEGQECQWWAMCDNPATTTEPHPILGDVPICDRCVAKLRKIEGLDEAEEDKWAPNFAQYEDTEKWEGQTVRIKHTTNGQNEGETGKVVKADKYRDENGGWQAEFQIKLHSGPVITLYPGEWSYDQLELEYDPTHRPDGKYNPELEEEVVEVPAGLRGEEGSSLSGRDAEQFINSLGPEDSPDTEVIDPDSGDVLDWPDRGTRRDQEERAEQERRDREEEEAWETPMLYSFDLKKHDDKSWDRINEFRFDEEFTDHYDVEWANMENLVDNPEQYYEGDYDISVDMPVKISRKDGKKFDKQDRENFKELYKIFRLATYNISVAYAGSSDDGKTAHFYPTFF